MLLTWRRRQIECQRNIGCATFVHRYDLLDRHWRPAALLLPFRCISQHMNLVTAGWQTIDQKMSARINFSRARERSLVASFHYLNQQARGRRQRAVFEAHDATDASTAERHHESNAAYVFAVLDLNSV